MSRSLAACSWSFRPESPDDLVAKCREAGIDKLQLALNPLVDGTWNRQETEAALTAAKIEILSGMMETVGEDYSTLESIAQTGGLRPDEHWEANLERAEQVAQLAAELKLSLVTFHAGFIPHEAGDARAQILERLRSVAKVFDKSGLRIGLETGQESAGTLSEVLDEIAISNLGVNFDPANMILYGMGDPVAALEKLAPRVFQIHVKDATPTDHPGTWGAEVAAGEGAVHWDAFFDVLLVRKLDVDLVIEREAGEQRVRDIQSARQLVNDQLARIGS